MCIAPVTYFTKTRSEHNIIKDGVVYKDLEHEHNKRSSDK